MKTPDMKSNLRQWLILRMIPTRRHIKITDIHKRLQSEYNITATLRTIQRDLVNLSIILPLVNNEERPAPGWSWGEDAKYFEIPSMDPLAALTFSMARDSMTRMLPRAALNSLGGYFRAADECLKKLQGSQLSHWPDKVRVVSRSLNFDAPDVNESVLDSLYEALQHEQRFELDYRSRSGKEKKYIVNPLGLVFVDNLIYLVATLNDHDDPIQLLAHRMLSIRLLPERPASVPKGFTLQGYIDSGEFGYPLGGTIKLKVLFDEGAVHYLYETKLVPNQKLTVKPEGKVLFEATVRDDVQLRWWLKGFGEKVEVLEPTDLRREFVEIARKMAGLYACEQI